MSSLNFIKDDQGASFIPSSQRPDGTWRKPIRVKDGYVPQEEQPLYVSKGKQNTQTRSDYPVGLSSSDVEGYSVRSSGGSKLLSGYFEVGNYEPATVIPGLNFVNSEEPEKVVTKSKSKKSKKKSSSESEDVRKNNQLESGQVKKTGPQSSNAVSGDSSLQTDPAKRLRNLKKRLKDIESLEKRIATGELSNPEKEQLEKINRKDDVLDEIDDLERVIESLSLS